MKNLIKKILRETLSEKTDYSKEKDKGLHGWFERQGGKGKSSGWVDCNTCRKNPKTGRKKCKPCGRKEGEKRSKYPACRPTPSACKTKGKGEKWGKKSKKESISEGLQYHIEKRIPIRENIYRFGSESYLDLLKEVRSLYFKGKLKLDHLDEEYVTSDMGTKDLYNGVEVWLDTPMEDIETLLEEDRFKGKKSGSPQRDTSGGKAYKVYVAGCAKKTDSNPRGIKLIRFGSGGLKAKLNNKEAKKAYNARHGCSKGRHDDKCKAGYWSCRLPRHSKKLNLSGGGTWW